MGSKGNDEFPFKKARGGVRGEPRFPSKLIHFFFFKQKAKIQNH